LALSTFSQKKISILSVLSSIWFKGQKVSVLRSQKTEKASWQKW